MAENAEQLDAITATSVGSSNYYLGNLSDFEKK